MNGEEDDWVESARQEDAARQRLVAFGMDDDPDEAAKAFNAQQDWGVPAGAVYGDEGEFDKQSKAFLANQLVQNNQHLRNYADFDWMAPSISNDDWPAMDAFTEAMGKVQWHVPTALGRALDAFNEGYEADTIEKEANELSSYAYKAASQYQGPWAIKQALLNLAGGETLHSLGVGAASMDHLFQGLMFGTARFGGSLISQTTGTDEERATREVWDALNAAQAHLPEPTKIPMGEARPAITPLTPLIESMQTFGQANRPWIFVGKKTPTGINLLVDEADKIQAEVDEKNVTEAFQRAMESKTRERVPGMWGDWIEQEFPNASISIPADAVRELYEGKVPEPEDGKLGFIPDLEKKLQEAEKYGGDIELPVKDWLTQVEPETYNALKDDFRIRPHGLTVTEAKELPPVKSTPTEIADQVRQIAGFDPLLSVADEKKLILQKVDEEPVSGPSRLFGRIAGVPKGEQIAGFHGYDFLNEKGERVGGATVSLTQDGRILTIENIAGIRGYGPNDFGAKMAMDLLRQLRQEFPDAQKLRGYRISGARKAAGVPLEKKFLEIDLDKTKFEKDGTPKGWDVVDSLLDALTGGEWLGLDHGVTAYIKPPELWTPEQRHAAEMVSRELQRIIGPKRYTDLAFAQRIRVRGTEPGGLFQTYMDRMPLVMLSFDSPALLKTGRHEIMHYLRQLGFFTPAEWATLERAATAGNWIEKHNIERRYPNLNNTQRLEEAICDEFGIYKAGYKADIHTSLHLIFEKIRLAFEKLKQTFLGELKARGIEPTAEDLFMAADIGEIGRREPTALPKEALEDVERRTAVPEPSLEAPEEAKLEEPGIETQPPFHKKPPGMPQERYNRILQNIENQRLHEAEGKEERLRKQQEREQTREWKGNRADLRKEVNENFKNRPDIAADEFFRTGKLFGAKVDKIPKLRADAIPEELRPGLEKYTAKDGIHPDDIAGLFGMRSGEELVQKLYDINQQRFQTGLEPKDFFKRMVDGETDRQMYAKYGNLADNVDLAVDDLLSPYTLQLLHEDTVYYAEKAGQQVPLDPAAVTAEVKRAVADFNMKNINYQYFMERGKKATNKAEEAASKGDWINALKHAQQREYAHIMAKEAKDYEKALKSFNSLTKSLGKREGLPSVKPSYTNFIHQIMVKVGKPVRRSIQDIENEIAAGTFKNLAEFVQAKRDMLMELEVPQFLADPKYSNEVKNMTGREFMAVKEGLDSMVNNGRIEQRSIIANDRADFDQQEKTALDFIREKGPLKFKGAKVVGIGKGVRSLGRKAMAAHIQIEALVERLEKGRFGPLTQVVRNLIDSVNRRDLYVKEIAGKLAALKAPKNMKQKIDNPLFREPKVSPDDPDGPLQDFTREDLLGVMARLGIEDNRNHLAAGYGIKDPTAIDAWVNKHATEEDWEFIKGIWKIFQEVKDKSDVMYRELSGLAPTSQVTRIIKTPFGDVQGGYFPRIPHEIWEGHSKGEAAPVQGKLGANYTKATIARDYTYEITGKIYPQSLSLDAIPNRLMQEIHDTMVRPAWLDAQRLLGSSKIKNAITKYMGPEYASLIDPYLADVAGVTKHRSDFEKGFEKWSELLRSQLVSTLVGFNPNTLAKHSLTSAINSITEVGLRNFQEALSSLALDNEESGLTEGATAISKSAELQRRHIWAHETLGGATKLVLDVPGIKKTLNKWRDLNMYWGSYPIGKIDLTLSTATWLAKYRESIRAGFDEERAVSNADAAVRRSHGSTAITSRPQIARMGPLMQWATSLYGFFNHIVQRQYEMAWRSKELIRGIRAGEHTWESGRLEAKKIATMMVSYVILPSMIEEFVSGGGDPDEGWEHKAARMMFGALPQSWIGVRDVYAGIEHQKQPVIGLIQTPTDTLYNIARDLGKEYPFSEEHAGKLIQDFATGMGIFVGLGHAQEGKVARYLYDMHVGNETPEGFGELQFGLRYGHGPREQ